MPPKIFTAQGKRDIKAENVEKKGGDGPPIMPSKRMNPMHEERTGQQKPPSRVLTNTAPTPTIPPPLIRSKVAQSVLKQPVSRLAYGLAKDKQKERGELDGITPVAALPPAPELDTQWVQLRRLQGRWIKGPHGDLLQADGIGSGVTEPFFFSAVRPGSSANKRASGWFGNTVNLLLESKSVVDVLDSSAKRRQSTVSDGSVPMGSTNSARQPPATTSMDPNATSVRSFNSSTAKKKVKNPNPTNLKEYIAFTFGGNNPTSIYQGTPSIVREFHAQCFPFVRADGFVEIATVAKEVIAPMAPTTSDIVEIAIHWLELESERDRVAITNAVNQQQDLLLPLDDNTDGAESATTSFPSVSRSQHHFSSERGNNTNINNNQQQQSYHMSSIAPAGFIQYAALLESVRKLLTNEHYIDLSYDLADVCADGVVNKAALKRAIGFLQFGGKAEEGYITVGEPNQNQTTINENTVKTTNNAAIGTTKNNNTPLRSSATSTTKLPSNNNINNNNNNNHATDNGTSSNSPGGSQTPAQFTSTKRSEINHARSYSKASNATSSLSMNQQTTTTANNGATNNQNNNNNNLIINNSFRRSAGAVTTGTSVSDLQQQQTTALRTLPDLFIDLRAEREEYQSKRAAEHPQLTQDVFVDDIIRSTTLGHERPARRDPSPPGRFWVTKNPKVVEKLVMSKHFQFNISSAVMRAFSHISNFEQHRAFFPKAKIGKKPKKNAQLPSMRQEHIRRSEFGDMFVSDPHIATPFLPYLMRCVICDLDPNLILANAIANEENNFRNGNDQVLTGKPTSPVSRHGYSGYQNQNRSAMVSLG